MDKTLTQLEQELKNCKQQTILNLFETNPNRFDTFSIQTNHLFLDYSKNLINQNQLDLLVNIAEICLLPEKINNLFSGKIINKTENRPALHTQLRAEPDLDKMDIWVESILSGQHKGCTGKSITDIINIGIGGSDLGPKMAVNALSPHKQTKNKLNLHFLSNIDGYALDKLLPQLNPETSLFIIATKSFGTEETITNALSIKKWLGNYCADKTKLSNHFIAITANLEKAKNSEIPFCEIFPLLDGIGGRYSLWSAIGLPIALSIGMDNFKKLLAGAHEMDQHFKNTPLNKNMPVIMALLSLWNQRLYQSHSHCVLPYCDLLDHFPDYLQQLSMESLGKSINVDGGQVNYHTGNIIWGATGTNGQHSFHQLLHQGTHVIPVDFILPLETHHDYKHHHDKLTAHCFSQSQALMLGAQGDGQPHKFIPGNRPSNTLLLNKLTPESLGALIALYEHKVYCQSIFWYINAFDQWGVELGKSLSKSILEKINTNQQTNPFDPSTNGLINKYLQT